MGYLLMAIAAIDTSWMMPHVRCSTIEIKEDCYHAVMECPHAKALRNAMREVWCLPPEERLHNVGPERFLVLLDSGQTEEVATLLWFCGELGLSEIKLPKLGRPCPLMAPWSTGGTWQSTYRSLVGMRWQVVICFKGIELMIKRRRDGVSPTGTLQLMQQLK
jgi:hypothetical protein